MFSFMFGVAVGMLTCILTFFGVAIWLLARRGNRATAVLKAAALAVKEPTNQEVTP